jgi:hypothetical protein
LGLSGEPCGVADYIPPIVSLATGKSRSPFRTSPALAPRSHRGRLRQAAAAPLNNRPPQCIPASAVKASLPSSGTLVTRRAVLENETHSLALDPPDAGPRPFRQTRSLRPALSAPCLFCATALASIAVLPLFRVCHRALKVMGNGNGRYEMLMVFTKRH